MKPVVIRTSWSSRKARFDQHGRRGAEDRADLTVPTSVEGVVLDDLAGLEQLRTQHFQ